MHFIATDVVQHSKAGKLFHCLENEKFKEKMVYTDILQNTDNTDRQAQLNVNPQGLVSLNNMDGGGASK